MPEALLGKPLDPKFPDYAYAGRPLVKVFKNRSGGKGVANLFWGKWMKIMDEQISESNVLWKLDVWPQEK